jgi:hypothetical protein
MTIDPLVQLLAVGHFLAIARGHFPVGKGFRGRKQARKLENEVPPAFILMTPAWLHSNKVVGSPFIPHVSVLKRLREAW